MADEKERVPERAGVQIGRHFFAFPTAFRLGDPVLVEELTGIPWSEWVDRLPDEDEPDDGPEDPVAMLGLIGVAIWQANPTWRRDRVVRYVNSIDKSTIEIVGPALEEPGIDDEEGHAGGGDDDPPALSE